VADRAVAAVASAPGLLRVSARRRHVSAGWFGEEAEVWDAAGRLVAQSRQLALVGRPALS
jgi:Acyl-CoA thioesterase C-terminal domain